MSLTPLLGHDESSVVNEVQENIRDLCQLRVINARELVFVEHVARGGMAQISLYMWNRRGYPPKRVAKKSLFRGSIHSRYEASLKKEMDLLAQLDHQNIVTTYGVVETDHDFGLVMEYLRFGSCRYFFGTLRDEADGRLSDLDQRLAPLKIQIVEEVIDGMNYLHGLKPKKVLHLDLKSDNVLLDDNLHAKICDFGLSRMATLTLLRNATTAKLDGIAGTPGYIPPETLRNPTAKPTSKSDVYSFAIFLWELLADRMPYEDIDCRQINLLKIYVVDQEGRPDENRIPNVYPQELIDMMKQAWSPRPESRPTFEDLREKMNLFKRNNSEIVQLMYDCTPQILALWESLCESSISTGRSKIDHDETDYRSTCVSEPVKCNTSTMTESTTPKRHTDAIVTPRHQILEKSSGVREPMRRTVSTMAEKTSPKRHTNATSRQQTSRNDSLASDDVPLLSLVSQDSNSDVNSIHHVDSMTIALNQRKKYPAMKIVLAIVVVLLVLGVGGVIIWILMTNRSGGSSQSQNCSPLPNPNNGNVSCTAQTETMNGICSFACNGGYSIQGESEIVCSGGKWSGKLPTCNPDCPPLNQIENGKYTCTNGISVDSTCSFSCGEHYQLNGSSRTTCLKTRKWSTPEPKCECPPCYTGPGCQKSIKWMDVIKALQPMKGYSTLVVHYGEESFTCTTQVSSLIIHFTGFCTDSKTGISSSCGKYSPPMAAMRAAAELVRRLEAQNIYPSPCDPEHMDTICDG